MHLMGRGWAENQEVKQWYDGVKFVNCTEIYNTWSIISFIKSRGKYDTYWLDTSSNGLVNSLMHMGTAHTKDILEELISEKDVSVMIDEQIVFNQLSENAVWSLLLASGYLKVTGHEELRNCSCFERWLRDESGFERYDVMLCPVDKTKDNAYIIAFKVRKPRKEKGGTCYAVF